MRVTGCRWPRTYSCAPSVRSSRSRVADSAAASRVEHLAAFGERGFELGARARDRFADDRAFRAVDALDRLADLVQRATTCRDTAVRRRRARRATPRPRTRRRPRGRWPRRERRDRWPRSRGRPPLARGLEQQRGAGHRDVERLPRLHRAASPSPSSGRSAVEALRSRGRGRTRSARAGRSSRARRHPWRSRRGTRRPRAPSAARISTAGLPSTMRTAKHAPAEARTTLGL